MGCVLELSVVFISGFLVHGRTRTRMEATGDHRSRRVRRPATGNVVCVNARRRWRTDSSIGLSDV